MEKSGDKILNRQALFNVFKTSFRHWQEDNAGLRAGALTFFIILPLPTLLLIIISIFSFFYGETQATQILVQQITAVAGPAVANLFSQLISRTGSPFTSIFSSIIVIGFSIGGAIGAFSVLRDTMDCIWNVRLAKGQPLWNRIKQKIVPFVIVSALGLIVIAWTAIATLLFNVIMLYSINDVLTILTITIAQILLSFGISTLLLAIIYKMIPQAIVHWRDVSLAAIVTGVAFTVTNYIFGTYIETFTVTTVAGAAGSLLIILLWIFILNQIVLFGAEISKVYATTVGIHARMHLPRPLESTIERMVRAGERIEETAKGPVVPTTEGESEATTEEMHKKSPLSPSEKEKVSREEAQHFETKAATGLPQALEKQGKEKEENVETGEQTAMKKEGTAESGKPEEGSVQFSIKIKTPRKKRKTED